MPQFLKTLFDSSDFPARWQCGVWSSAHGWTHIIADVLVFGAYTAIPCVLAYFIVRRRDIVFPRIFWLFCAFIFACGTVHLVEAVVFWQPIYRVSALAKVITAAVSWAAVIALVYIAPTALKLPGLVRLNAALEDEVAERKRMEGRLRDQAQILESSNRELERFAYATSHDMKEPLRMVASYLQLLEMRCSEQLDDKARTYVKAAVDGATRMHGMIDDILQYSRAGRSDEPMVECDTDAIVDEVLRNLEVAMKEAQAVVVKDNLPRITGHRTQLAVLFQNLIANALKFRRTEPPRIELRAKPGADGVTFTVRDNGIGVEPAHFARIFEIFQRLHTREEYPGSGIGLAVCKRIVENHSGRIWVDSEPGEGSAFSFFIPRREP